MTYSEAVRGIPRVIASLGRAITPPETRPLSPEELAECGMGEVPRPVPHHGSDEAKIHALAADLVRRRGATKAGELADLLVACVQKEARK